MESLQRFQDRAISIIDTARIKDDWSKNFLQVKQLIRFDRSVMTYKIPGGGALGPNMYGCVPLMCCDFHPVWEHFPQFKYPRLGAKWQKTTPCVGAKDQENTL